jgi:uncharacterized protein YndB with AHSA1/START domain
MDRHVTHATFTLERSYPVPPARVFAAWADPAAKARWFTPGEDGGTRLVLTEQGAYLDGQEQPAWREHGTADQLEALAAQLKADG